MSKQFYFKQFNSVSTVLISKIFLFQAIQFCISTQFSSILPIDRTLSGATTPGQSGPGSNGNAEVLRIPQSSSITGTSSSDCLLLYAEHSLGGLTPLQKCSRCILQSQPTGQRLGALAMIVDLYNRRTNVSSNRISIKLLSEFAGLYSPWNLYVVFVYPRPLLWAECGTMSIFKRSTAALT